MSSVVDVEYNDAVPPTLNLSFENVFDASEENGINNIRLVINNLDNFNIIFFSQINEIPISYVPNSSICRGNCF